MPHFTYGKRIAKSGKLRVACSAMIMEDEKVLLFRRTDNNQWSLPGGGLNSGESVSECCIREVLEETGLVVKLEYLIAIYSNPNILVSYEDGNAYHIIVFHFATSYVSGKLSINDEAIEFKYFSKNEIETLDLIDIHKLRIQDYYLNNNKVIIS